MNKPKPIAVLKPTFLSWIMSRTVDTYCPPVLVVKEYAFKLTTVIRLQEVPV